MLDANTIDKINLAIEQFSTPFYLLDLDSIRAKIELFRNAWKNKFPNCIIAYSFKSNSLNEVIKIVKEYKLAAEVVSSTEMEWATLHGFKGSEIFFDGPVKKNNEIKNALDNGVNIQVDSFTELQNIIYLSNGRVPCVSLRLSSVIKNGEKQSRFGFTPSEFKEAIAYMNIHNIILSGIHIHIGSNINNPKEYALSILNTLTPILDIVLCHSKTNKDFWIDIGGGFSSNSYSNEVVKTDDTEYADLIYSTLHAIGLLDCKLIVEPGRRFVEDSGYLIASVVTQKKRNEKVSLVLDVGISDVRSIYSWHHPVSILPANSNTQLLDIWGCNCFESDILAEDVLGNPESNYVVLGNVGGYDIPSANSWIRPLPKILGFDKKGIRQLRREANSNELKNLEYFFDNVNEY